VDLVRDLERVPLRRALVEHGRGEPGQAGEIIGIGTAPGAEHQVGRDDRQMMSLDEIDREAVRSANCFGVGSWALATGPGPGTVLRHGSLDSTFAWSVFSGFAGAVGSGGSFFSPGTACTTTREFLPSDSIANFFTASGVTAAKRAMSLLKYPGSLT
jgi:hypothetical protein